MSYSKCEVTLYTTFENDKVVTEEFSNYLKDAILVDSDYLSGTTMYKGFIGIYEIDLTEEDILLLTLKYDCKIQMKHPYA